MGRTVVLAPLIHADFGGLVLPCREGWMVEGKQGSRSQHEKGQRPERKQSGIVPKFISLEE